MIEKEVIKRIKKWGNNKKAAPHTIEAKITLRCNLKCPFCDNAFISNEKEIEKKKKEVSMKKWLKIINFFKGIRGHF